jgi:RNase adaptor protein for sRNA GlmZ degradation
MKRGGRYELVAAPGDADLVLDVNVIPNSVVWQFKLEILDPKTGIVLWAISEPTRITASKKTRDKDFDDTINKLVGDLRTLTTQ